LVAPSSVIAGPADRCVDPAFADHQRRAAIERRHFSQPRLVRLEQVGEAVKNVPPRLGRSAAPLLAHGFGLCDRFFDFLGAGQRDLRLRLLAYGVEMEVHPAAATRALLMSEM